MLLLALAVLTTSVAAPSAEDIIKKMDDNMTFGTRISESEMIIESPSGKEVKKLRVWARGQTDTYAEFTAPERDKGVKYLKLGDNLYMFLPRTEKVVKISGHLLRQSLMDSDFSYEDMMESRALLDNYNAKILREETKDGEPCWLLELISKRDGVGYYRRLLWVSQKTYVAVLAQRYAKSGVLLKELQNRRIMQYGGRNYPTQMIMQDKLKQGTRTTLQMTAVKFDAQLPDSLFSRRNLMRRR